MNAMHSESDAEPSLVSKTLTVCAVVAAITSGVALLFTAKNLLPLIFGAILIAVVLNRLATSLTSVVPKSLSRRVRIAIVIGTLALVVGASAFTFASAASEQIVALSDRIESSVKQVVTAAKEHPLVSRFLSDNQSVSSLLPPSERSLGFAKNFFSTTFGVVTDCLVLAVLSIYFCISPAKYREGATRLVPMGWREPFTELLSASAETLWRWMLGRALAMTIVGVLFGVGLAAIGIPMPVELGIFAGLVTFIPNIGGIAAVLPALLLASQEGSTDFLVVALLYLAIQLVESYLITPMVQEHQVALPPAMVILAQILLGVLFGFWGIVFATPLVAVAQLWTKRLYVEQWLERSCREDVE